MKGGCQVGIVYTYNILLTDHSTSCVIETLAGANCIATDHRETTLSKNRDKFGKHVVISLYSHNNIPKILLHFLF